MDPRLVIVSNRIAAGLAVGGEWTPPSSAGGLVSAVSSALKRRESLWFGWSGKLGGSASLPSNPSITNAGNVALATIDLPRRDFALYYSIFSNQTLWPLFHSFPRMVVIRWDAYLAYRRINQRFAEALYPLLRPGDIVWVHDYHLISLGAELRALGWQGKMGFFLHVPFPPQEIFRMLPWDKELLLDFFAYDLVGLHTARYAFNLQDTMQDTLGATVADGVVTNPSGAAAAIGRFPIGIDPDTFPIWAAGREPRQTARLLDRIAGKSQVMLGVDRLDYTKGIRHRLLAFEHLLVRRPSLRGKVILIQISTTSRGDLPEYAEEKLAVDALVGRINGQFSQAGWIPVHSLHRTFSREELAAIYRHTDVCLVTPLRDGMNLVAKEYVASQGRDDPGVLLLSEFAGAGETMHDAVSINPHDIEGVATAMHYALSMSLAERQQRWDTLIEDVRSHTARNWCDDFLEALQQTRWRAPQPAP